MDICVFESKVDKLCISFLKLLGQQHNMAIYILLVVFKTYATNFYNCSSYTI